MGYYQYQIDAAVEELVDQFVQSGRDSLSEYIDAYDPAGDGDFDSYVENYYDTVVSDLEDMIMSEARGIQSRMYDLMRDEKNDLVSSCSVETFTCPKCEHTTEVNTDNLDEDILCEFCGETFLAHPPEVVEVNPVSIVGNEPMGYIAGCYF